jgi:hypothetical protein
MSARIAGMVVAIATLWWCAVADAGTYTVSGCRTSWIPVVRNTTTNGSGVGAYDLCGNGRDGMLEASLAVPGVSSGDYAGWRFDAPAGTAITAVTVRWQGRGDHGTVDWATALATLDASTGGQAIQHNDLFTATTETLQVPDADWVQAYVICRGDTAPTCRGGIIFDNGSPDVTRVALFRSTVTLVDRLGPEIQQAAGAAVTDPVWTGIEPLSFRAEDKGGGLYRVLVEVDGAIVRALPATADDRCVDQTGNRDFAYAVPCPTAGGGSVQIDTAGLPEGAHVVGVYVEDVAGNRSPLMPPSRIRIVNDVRTVGYFANGRFFNPRFASPRVLNGANATSGARLTAAFARQVGKGKARHTVLRASREVRYSQRATVRGRLTTPSGEPIAHATVFVGQQPEGQQWRIDGTARTDTKGGFVYRSPARRPNRQLRAVYFPFSDSNENVASGVLKLGVRAGLTLHVNRHRLHNGDRLVFSGRVLGPVPTAGVAVTLQAKVGRHYRSFRQLRATSRTNGRLRTVYRFERTTQPARYRFRLKLVRQAGLPFQSGVSPVASVSVSP